MYKHWLRLAKAYKKEFQKDPDGFLHLIGKGDSIRGCLLCLYYEFVHRNKCERIEAISEAEKVELWEEAKCITPKGREHLRMDICRAIHALVTYCNMEGHEV